MAAHPPLSDDVIRSLLEGGETAGLDFKAKLDLDSRADLVSIAKDVAAMQALGGFLVIGVNDDGTLSRQVEARHAELLDEASFRAKLKRYLPEPIDLVTHSVVIDGATVVAVHIAPRDDGFCVMAADGTYARDGEPKPTVAFRKGDVFVRHGTSSERWAQADAVQALDRVMSIRKEQWRTELRDDISQLGLDSAAQAVVRGPSGAFTWKLDSATFESGLVELLRADDLVPVRLLLAGIARDASSVMSDAHALDELLTLLDRLAQCCAIATLLEDERLVLESIRAFVSIYDLGFDTNGFARYDIHPPASRLWQLIVERIFALGGLAVRRQRWEVVRELAVQHGRGEDFRWFGSWLRHAVVMAARAGHLDVEDENGRRISLSLMLLAQEHAQRVPALHPDVSREDESLLSSICQFDLLAGLAAVDAADDLDDRSWYTNFARFDWSRAEPALERLLSDSRAREAIFPRSDAELAEAARAISRRAKEETFRYMVSSRWNSPSVKDLLEAHPETAS